MHAGPGLGHILPAGRLEQVLTVVLVCCCAVRLNTGSLLGSVLLAWGLGCGLSCCKPTTRIEETHSAVMVWPCGMWGCCPVSAASPGQATQPLWASVSSHVQGGLHSLIPKSKKFQKVPKNKKMFLKLDTKTLGGRVWPEETCDGVRFRHPVPEGPHTFTADAGVCL